jgi:hypothetical protein
MTLYHVDRMLGFPHESADGTELEDSTGFFDSAGLEQLGGGENRRRGEVSHFSG